MARIRTEENRQRLISNTLPRLLAIIKEMEDSEDIDFTQKTVRITSTLSIEVNCHRTPDSDEWIGWSGWENGEFIGWPLSYEIVAIKEGIDYDAVTIDSGGDFSGDIKYLLDCCV